MYDLLASLEGWSRQPPKDHIHFIKASTIMTNKAILPAPPITKIMGVEMRNFTIEQLLHQNIRKELDPRPRFCQRGPAWSTSNMANFLKSVVEFGIGSVPPLAIRELDATERTNHYPYLSQLIDGQQRLLTFADFFDIDDSRDGPKIRLPKETTYTDPSGNSHDVGGFSASGLERSHKSLYHRLLTANIYVAVGRNMTDVQAAEWFINLNNNSKMKAQEQRNAVQSAFQIFVQNLARFESHPVFDQAKKEMVKGNDKFRPYIWDTDSLHNVKPLYLGFTNKGLSHDEELVKMAVWIVGYDLDPDRKFPSKKNLDRIYGKPGDYGFTVNQFPPEHEVAITNRLDFLHCVLAGAEGDYDRTKLAKGTVFNLFMLVDKWLRDWGKVHVEDPTKFMHWFLKTHTDAKKLSKDGTASKYDLATRHPDYDEATFGRRIRPFLENLPHDESEIGLRFLDKKRSSNALRSELYTLHNGECQHGKHQMKISDARLAHKKAHSKGGKTDVSNCTIICHNANIAQGTSDWERFQLGDPNGESCGTKP